MPLFALPAQLSVGGPAVSRQVLPAAHRTVTAEGQGPLAGVPAEISRDAECLVVESSKACGRHAGNETLEVFPASVRSGREAAPQ